MYEYMSHTFHFVPWSFRMFCAELIRQFIGGFSDNFQLLDKTKEDNRVFFGLLHRVPFTTVRQIVNGGKNMYQTFFVSNTLSHKS